MPTNLVATTVAPSSNSSCENGYVKFDLSSCPKEYDKNTPRQERIELEKRVWAEFLQTRDEEARQELRTWLFWYNKKIPLSAARRYAKNYHSERSLLDLDDILSYANAGLLEAINGYNPNEGVKFNTFATYRVYGSIADGLRDLQNFSREIIKARREIAPLINILRHELQKEPTLTELVERFPNFKVGGSFGVPLSDYIDNSLITANVYNFQELKDSSDAELNPNLLFESCLSKRSKNPQAQPFDRLQRQMLIDKILRILVDPKERTVIYQYFFMGFTSSKIAKINHLSQSIVSNKKIDGIRTLRKAVKNDSTLGEELLELLAGG